MIRCCVALAVMLAAVFVPGDQVVKHSPVATAAMETERHQVLAGDHGHGHAHDDGDEYERSAGHTHGHDPTDHAHEVATPHRPALAGMAIDSGLLKPAVAHIPNRIAIFFLERPPRVLC